MLNVVILNGGRGAAAVIPALLARQGLHVTSVVNAYDDGKSTGEIRRFFGMLGPSDIRKVQELMLPVADPDYQANLELFQYRFPQDCQREYVLAHLQAFAASRAFSLYGVLTKVHKIPARTQRFSACLCRYILRQSARVRHGRSCLLGFFICQKCCHEHRQSLSQP